LEGMSAYGSQHGRPVIEARGLTKVFTVRKQGRDIFDRLLNPGRTLLRAVDGVSFDIREGEVFGLLGRNGSGKTTIIQMLCGLIQPTEGSVRVFGEAVEGRMGSFGLMMGRRMIYNRLTGYNNLEYYANLYGVPDAEGRIAGLCGMLGIGEWIDEYAEYYSDGMKSKLAFARALIHDPDILILDEPTLGLDVATTERMHGIIAGLGKTVLITTHYMEEAKTLCDRVVILSDGRIRREIADPASADLRGELLDGRA